MVREGGVCVCVCVCGEGGRDVGKGETFMNVCGWVGVGYGCVCVGGGKSGNDRCNRGWNQLLST